MNLPNTITAGRILAAPFIAALPFIGSPTARGLAFTLYVIAALTDYYDGWLARTRNLITDLGRLLDPLADKLLLFATLIPMFVLMAPPMDPLVPTRAESIDAARLQFQTPWGSVGLPWDGDHRAAYALLRPDFTIEARRVGYDHEASARAVRDRFGDAEWAVRTERRLREARP